jgi:sulfide:quinone oxidoreductase
MGRNGYIGRMRALYTLGKTRGQIVILGCGFAGLRAFYHLRKKIGGSAELTLIDERKTSLEKPSLPEVALSGKPVEHVQMPIEPLLGERGTTFINSKVELIEPAKNTVVLASGEGVHYDYLLIALGAVKGYDAIPGFRKHGYSICDDVEAPRLWEALLKFGGGPVVVGAARTRWGTRVNVPALAAPCEGPVGEIAFMLDHFLRERGIRGKSTITMVSPGKVFFEDVGPRVHEALAPAMKEHGISVLTDKRMSRIEEGRVVFEDGTALESRLSIVIPEYLGSPVVIKSGLGDEKGFVPTDREMRHLDHRNVFAAGDVASLSMPKLGHIAVMQADIAAASIIHDMTGEGKIPAFEPEVFCVMNRGGTDATLILSDFLYGGDTDLALSGPAAHLMKWSFDTYYFYSKGHMPPEMIQGGLEALLRTFSRVRGS